MTEQAQPLAARRLVGVAARRWVPAVLLLGVILLSCGVGKFAVSPADL